MEYTEFKLNDIKRDAASYFSSLIKVSIVTCVCIELIEFTMVYFDIIPSLTSFYLSHHIAFLGALLIAAVLCIIGLWSWNIGSKLRSLQIKMLRRSIGKHDEVIDEYKLIQKMFQENIIEGDHRELMGQLIARINLAKGYSEAKIHWNKDMTTKEAQKQVDFYNQKIKEEEVLCCKDQEILKDYYGIDS